MISEHLSRYDLSLGHLVLLFLPLTTWIIRNLNADSKLLKKGVLLLKELRIMRRIVVKTDDA